MKITLPAKVQAFMRTMTRTSKPRPCLFEEICAKQGVTLRQGALIEDFLLLCGMVQGKQSKDGRLLWLTSRGYRHLGQFPVRFRYKPTPKSQEIPLSAKILLKMCQAGEEGHAEQIASSLKLPVSLLRPELETLRRVGLVKFLKEEIAWIVAKTETREESRKEAIIRSMHRFPKGRNLTELCQASGLGRNDVELLLEMMQADGLVRPSQCAREWKLSGVQDERETNTSKRNLWESLKEELSGGPQGICELRLSVFITSRKRSLEAIQFAAQKIGIVRQLCDVAEIWCLADSPDVPVSFWSKDMQDRRKVILSAIQILHKGSKRRTDLLMELSKLHSDVVGIAGILSLPVMKGWIRCGGNLPTDFLHLNLQAVPDRYLSTKEDLEKEAYRPGSWLVCYEFIDEVDFLNKGVKVDESQLYDLNDFESLGT